MTHLEAKQGILKVDSRGRVQTPPERREALLDEFERCGLSGRRFAKMVGVVPVTVEKALKQAKAEPKVNEARRAAQSVPVLQRLHRVLLLLKNRRGILPQSGFGKAIRYALGEWESVLVYAGDGRVEIDKNPCERAIRFTAVGKKNCIFFGQAEAGERSAIVYTIIESCRRRGIDPYTYLRDVITWLPTMTN